MRGLSIKYTKLSLLLHKARIEAGMTLDSAAMLIGIYSATYLSQCEMGKTGFPLKKLKRAAEVYGMSPEEISKAIADDYALALNKFWENHDGK